MERSCQIEFKILDSWARGPMVINERIDSFTRSDARSGSTKEFEVNGF